MARKGNSDIEDIDTEYRPAPSNAARAPRPSARDKSLVRVLVLAKNVPVGVVQDPVLDEDGNQLFDEGKPLVGKDGQPVLDAAGEPKFDQPIPRTKIVERHLVFKERVMMEKWCADIMASEGREHVEIL